MGGAVGRGGDVAPRGDAARRAVDVGQARPRAPGGYPAQGGHARTRRLSPIPHPPSPIPRTAANPCDVPWTSPSYTDWAVLASCFLILTLTAFPTPSFFTSIPAQVDSAVGYMADSVREDLMSREFRKPGITAQLYLNASQVRYPGAPYHT